MRTEVHIVSIGILNHYQTMVEVALSSRKQSRDSRCGPQQKHRRKGLVLFHGASLRRTEISRSDIRPSVQAPSPNRCRVGQWRLDFVTISSIRHMHHDEPVSIVTPLGFHRPLIKPYRRFSLIRLSLSIPLMTFVFVHQHSQR